MVKLLKNILVVAFLFCASCAPTIKNFAEFEKQPILKAEYFDKKSFVQKPPKIVVLNFASGDSKIAQQANLGETLATAVENTLASAKLVELLDRKAFKNLAEEIALNELKGEATYSGPASADYAVSGNIATAGFAHKYTGSSVRVNPDGSVSSVPAQHRYTANYEGNIKIYKLPNLEVTQVIPLKGSAVRKEDAVVDGLLFTKKVNTDQIVKRDDNLVRKAALSAVGSKKRALKNYFSSLRKGYILEKRSHKKQIIFRINLGKKDALRHGQKVRIFAKDQIINPLNDEVEIEEIEIGKAIVTNLINSKSAWIIVKDKNIAHQIKLGDYVTVKY